MGFSVSSSFAVIAFGAFVAMSTLYGATADAAEDRQDARTDQLVQRETVADTSINITSADVFATGCGVEVTVTNTGATKLLVNETDLLVDGEYRTGWEADATVDGEPDTDLWLPGQQLVISVSEGIDEAPDRVKVVTGPGVAATQRIDGGVLC